MKCIACGKAKMIRETRDVKYTYKGHTKTISNVSGEFCPRCNESLHTEDEAEYLSSEMLAFTKSVNGAAVDPEFITETRKKLKLDQRQAAELFGVKQPDVSKLLHGDFRQFSLERLPGSDWGGDWAMLEGVEVTGTHAGTIRLKQAFAPFLMTALAGSSGFILSRKAVEKAGGKFTTEIPATCGPYLMQWTPKQQMVFTPNPAWPGSKPTFGEVRYMVIDDNKAAELAFAHGDVDRGRVGRGIAAHQVDRSLPRIGLRKVRAVGLPPGRLQARFATGQHGKRCDNQKLLHPRPPGRKVGRFGLRRKPLAARCAGVRAATAG